MAATEELIDAPLTQAQLSERWRELCADPSFEDFAAKIELTEWGEILVSPVGKTLGLTAARIAHLLRQTLDGYVMVAVGIATSIGVRAPDVAWCSEHYLQAQPEEAPLTSAPELCIEIASASNALPKLREKANAYLKAGALEAWLVFPKSRQVEIYGVDGRCTTTRFDIDLTTIF